MSLHALENGDSFSPTTIEEEEAWALGKGIIIRGAQHEIGKVTSISRQDPDDQSLPSAKLSRSENELGKIFTRINVGDVILTGDTLYTDKSTVIEILLGLNSRLRLNPGTHLQMADMVAKKTMKGIITRRKIELLDGSIRVRVRKNTITPSHVLIEVNDAEIVVGLERLAAMGGIDAYIRFNPADQEADVSVFNGSIELFRPSYLSRNAERITVSSGYRVVIPELKIPSSAPLTLASPYFDLEEVEDWSLFVKRLNGYGAALESEQLLYGKVENNLWLGLGEELRQEIIHLAGTQQNGDPSLEIKTEFRQALIARLNWLLEQGLLSETRKKKYGEMETDTGSENVFSSEMALPASEMSLRNRLLVEAVFPGIIRPLSGDSMRIKTAIKALRMASAFSTEEWLRTAMPPPLEEEMLSGP